MKFEFKENKVVYRQTIDSIDSALKAFKYTEFTEFCVIFTNNIIITNNK